MNAVAESYTVLWDSYRCDWLAQAGEIGKPIEVIFGGEHQSVPSLSRFKVKPGDHVFPIRVHKRVLYVIARLTISKIISLKDYVANQLALSTNQLKMHDWDLQGKLWKERPELGHRLPYDCVFEAAIGEGTPMTLDCAVPSEVVEAIRYRSLRGDRPIKHVTNGLIMHTASICGGVYRLTPDSAKSFHKLVNRSKNRGLTNKQSPT